MEEQGFGSQIGLILSGQEIPIEGADIFITQPTIKQIVAFGEDDFFVGVDLLAHTEHLLSKIKEGNSELELYSDFQLLMIVLMEDLSIKMIVQNLFELIFPNYLVQINDNFINFFIHNEDLKNTDEDNLIMVGQLHPYNFQTFQQLLLIMFEPQKTEEEKLLDYKPINDAAAAIAEKLKKGRQKVQELQGQKGPQSLFANYISTLSVGLHMDVRIFFEYTPFQLYDSYKRFFEKESNDLYMRVSTMPFMDVSKMEAPKPWSRNLY